MFTPQRKIFANLHLLPKILSNKINPVQATRISGYRQENLQNRGRNYFLVQKSFFRDCLQKRASSFVI